MQKYKPQPSTKFKPLTDIKAKKVVELQVGLRKGKNDQLTVSLPQPEAFADYDHVWLTDHETGIITDLQQQDYSFTVAHSDYDEQRLTLRIGGQRPTAASTDESSDYLIYSRQHHLIIKGLYLGDRISIFTVGGALIERCTATDADYRHPLRPAVYIVKIDSNEKRRSTVKKFEVN